MSAKPAEVLTKAKESQTSPPSPQAKPSFGKRWGLWIGFAVMLAILLMPFPDSLPTAGHRMLAIFAFAVIVWFTEAVSYPVSIGLLISMTAFLLMGVPNPAADGVAYTVNDVLQLMLGGLTSGMVLTNFGALVIAAALAATGLDRRIALMILSRVGTKPSSILGGVLATAIILTFLIPASTARAAALVPIVLGLVTAVGEDRKSTFSRMLMVAMVTQVSITNIGVMTGGTQNLLAVGIIQNATGYTIGWGEWLIYAFPYAIVMSLILYFMARWVFPVANKDYSLGRQEVRNQLKEMGPMSAEEKRLLGIVLVTLALWATSGTPFKLHSLGLPLPTLLAVVMITLPGIGVMNWKQTEQRVPWGTILVFAVGIAFGTALLRTGAANWLADATLGASGLASMNLFVVFAVIIGFIIVLHLGFASATSVTSALLPVVIAFLGSTQNPDVSIWGWAMLVQMSISMGFILPVNSPQNMLAYGTDTFEVSDMVKLGVPFTVAAFLVFLLFGATLWRGLLGF